MVRDKRIMCVGRCGRPAAQCIPSPVPTYVCKNANCMIFAISTKPIESDYTMGRKEEAESADYSGYYTYSRSGSGSSSYGYVEEEDIKRVGAISSQASGA